MKLSKAPGSVLGLAYIVVAGSFALRVGHGGHAGELFRVGIDG